jgi:hypothetical protein
MNTSQEYEKAKTAAEKARVEGAKATAAAAKDAEVK